MYGYDRMYTMYYSYSIFYTNFEKFKSRKKYRNILLTQYINQTVMYMNFF